MDNPISAKYLLTWHSGWCARSFWVRTWDVGSMLAQRLRRWPNIEPPSHAQTSPVFELTFVAPGANWRWRWSPVSDKWLVAPAGRRLKNSHHHKMNDPFAATIRKWTLPPQQAAGSYGLFGPVAARNSESLCSNPGRVRYLLLKHKIFIKTITDSIDYH